LPLKFLAKNKAYIAEIYRAADDADWKKNPLVYKIEKRLVTRDSILPLHLATGGGEAIRLKPATQRKNKKRLKQRVEALIESLGQILGDRLGARLDV
jgi:hypothetical protein